MSTVGTTCPIDRKKVTIVSPDPVAMTLKVRVVDTIKEKIVPLKEFDDIRTIGFFTTNPMKQAVISGEVYKPESYPISEVTTLKDVILGAGGLTKYAFLDRAHVTRTLLDDGKKFSTQDYFISLRDLNADAAGFVLSDKDVITIYNIDELTVRSSVAINGEVYKPGSFKIDDNTTTLRDMILAAGGLTKFAFLDRARISRTLSVDGKKFITQEFFLPLQDINQDAAAFNLMDKDSITIYSIDELNVRPVATVNGEVYKPGSFNIDQNKTTVRDLILAAGGVTLKADQKIEIVRYSIKDGKRISTIIPENINHVMGDNSPKVVAYDEINLFSIPEWGNRRSIKLFGKVRYPGEYTIQKGEKLTDVLNRAGGFSDEAFLAGAVFTRTDIKKIQTDAINAQINELEHKATIIAATPKSSGTGAAAMGADTSSLMAMIGSLKEQTKTLDIPGRMTVRLDDDLGKLAQSPYNVSLKDGDALYIPGREDSVTIVGEVMNPSAVIHTTDDAQVYIDHAGGLKESADESNIFVIHANGEAEKVSKHFYTANAKVGVGDSIVVPIKLDAYPTMLFVKDISSVLYQFAIAVAALHTIGTL
jgi:protein involved in polysaccharide export with SLBB domain